MKDQTLDESTDSLKSKVEEWLSTEGYPLEFTTASMFRKGFRVSQGFHVRDPKTGAVREIDVIASAETRAENYIIRFSYVIECKWSRDKPWVIFTSPHNGMLPSACISQTIASKLGRAALWCVAGDNELEQTETFSSPLRSGFGGRQAFAGGKDTCYSALQSVVSASYLLSEYYDRNTHPAGRLPSLAFVGLPVIVVDGFLFEAFFEEETGRLQVLPVEMVRLHWRGAERWRFFSTIDIISAGYVEKFVAKRKSEAPVILNAIKGACENIQACFAKGGLDDLKVTPGPRGTLGLPALLEPLALKKKTRGS